MTFFRIGQLIKKLSPAKLLVGASKVLGGKGTKKGEFAGKDGGADDLGEFLCIGTRGCPATGNAEQFQALLLGIDPGTAADRADRK